MVDDKTNDNLDVYTFDFQQQLPSPNMLTNDIFYKRPLWTYNFGVHDAKTGDGIMNMWSEGEAGRGSAEVSSLLHKIFKTPKKNKVAFSEVHWFSFCQSEVLDIIHPISTGVTHSKETWCRYNKTEMEP
ncbi:hypothetical protein PoB_006585900 [Plakobranchus ocellatus]|uniref:Uncharacterized protein n=1 Tax=Plakobranchus ocellatus TaxID=259542 RepID=A0AAV4D592_9GAST|nr:hypothetical protein PoB_006585900 [Plakobranchus ocellatus]